MNTTTKTRVNDWNQVGTVWVHRYSILTTNCVVYAAYEASEGGAASRTHSSLMSHGGTWLGELTSRRLPDAVEALKGTVRYDACDAFRAANRTEAYAAIVAAFPEAAEGTRRDGQIEVWA